MYQRTPQSTIKCCSLSNPNMKQAIHWIIFWSVNQTSFLLPNIPKLELGRPWAVPPRPHFGWQYALSCAPCPASASMWSSLGMVVKAKIVRNPKDPHFNVSRVVQLGHMYYLLYWVPNDLIVSRNKFILKKWACHNLWGFALLSVSLFYILNAKEPVPAVSGGRQPLGNEWTSPRTSLKGFALPCWQRTRHPGASWARGPTAGYTPSEPQFPRLSEQDGATNLAEACGGLQERWYAFKEWLILIMLENSSVSSW